MDPEEGRRLYEIALDAGRLGPCLEVGSYCGKSTLYLGAACKATGTVLFAIDHHRGSEEHQLDEQYFDAAVYDAAAGRVDTFPTFRQTIERAQLLDTVVPLVCSSQLAARAWATPLSLVFIDGGHSQQAAETDLACWSPHIMAGGFLVIHDIFPDPAQGGQAPYLIYQKAIASERFAPLPMLKTLGVLKRV